MSIWRHLETQISEASGRAFSLARQRTMSGGCINQATCITGADESEYFIKFNRAVLLPMFEAESMALSEMADSQSVRVPQPLCSGVYGGQAYLVMAYLPLTGRADMSALGAQLAAMHRNCAPQFGWPIDNTIGSTPQPNQQGHDWIAFWREQRMGFQLELAARNGYRGELQRKGERLLADFPVLFASYTPQASMLHGDLWSGNYGGLADGSPVIFDPALYYGDRETDLAMTALFGGFGGDFYAAYNDAWPLDVGYSVRKTFYNIYHIINHLNLFGGGYQSQAINMIEQVLSEI